MLFGAAELHFKRTGAGVDDRLPGSPESQESDALARLLVFCHPHCPCTRATLLELRRVLAHEGVPADCQVYFYRPRGESQDWATGSLRSLAASLPGVTIRDDPDGDRARAFGARTSGHTLLYGRDGRLLFDGGLQPLIVPLDLPIVAIHRSGQ